MTFSSHEYSNRSSNMILHEWTYVCDRLPQSIIDEENNIKKGEPPGENLTIIVNEYSDGRIAAV